MTTTPTQQPLDESVISTMAGAPTEVRASRDPFHRTEEERQLGYGAAAEASGDAERREHEKSFFGQGPWCILAAVLLVAILLALLAAVAIVLGWHPFGHPMLGDPMTESASATSTSGPAVAPLARGFLAQASQVVLAMALPSAALQNCSEGKRLDPDRGNLPPVGEASSAQNRSAEAAFVQALRPCEPAEQ
eukprot:CAMPEP_0170583578 /NCGR_PEP_ID=MMETSP0224-20130122/8212_1 /TAXON_ID=285029 /ORGANISM="Togula jolla, Strain CCCM 725" /LENGTH=190 /DNA_ID=CAMNT_0010906919 /DNA_START=22 /DNA_END=594 /DNA_ORIENTATION=-